MNPNFRQIVLDLAKALVTARVQTHVPAHHLAVMVEEIVEDQVAVAQLLEIVVIAANCNVVVVMVLVPLDVKRDVMEVV